MQERDIFIAALARNAAERSGYLAGACGDDGELRRRVEQLLLEHEKEQSFFLDAPLPVVNVTVDPPDRAQLGRMIGPYKLLQVIGEGGMGIVYMAEQVEPVQRRVALKVIKPGMDSRQVIARFEAERQALALMDHVNIARVLDAGTTGGKQKDEGGRMKDEKEKLHLPSIHPSSFIPHPSSDSSFIAPPSSFREGRPYFVMELVHGVPITKYCDDNHLTPRERLELFVPVCQAIQHAHQKGIIHRDIKPSNVMVTLYDGKPVPKVIDFGVAKATEQKLTERTLFTQYGTMVGTLEYMSPEQAEMSALGVDTRSDIYSLGVLLYELLTGSTPLSNKRMKEAAYGEILRMIKEEEPPKPSTRLSESGEALASISAQRQMDPVKLTKLMRGELDWIVMKTLEKDRNRRYESANAFAADVQRYLNDEAVLACPPSLGYRFRKFARKNRAILATTGTIALLLIVGIVVSGWQALRATKAERETADQRDAARTNELRALSSEVVARKKEQEAIDARDELRNTLYAAEMNLVQMAWEVGNVPRVHELLQRQIPGTGQRDLRGFEWHYWDRLGHAESNTLQISGLIPDPPFEYPAIRGDGVQLAVLSPTESDLELQIWDTTTGLKINSTPVPGGRQRRWVQAISADGGRVSALGFTDVDARAATFDLRVWDSLTGKELAAIPVPGVGPEQHGQLSMSDDGDRILTVIHSIDRSGRDIVDPVCTAQLNVWDVAARKALLTVPLTSVRFRPALSADGTRAAVIVSLEGNHDPKAPHGVKVWDVDTGAELLTLKGARGEPLDQVLFSPDGKKIAATGFSQGGNGVWVWDAVTGKELRAFSGRRAASSIQFNRNGSSLANYSSNSPTVTVWDLTTGQPQAVFKGNASGVVGLAFCNNGRQIRTIAKDGTIRTWDLPDAQRANPDGTWLSRRLAVMAISPDGTRIADLPVLGPEAGLIQILDTTGKRIRSIPFLDRSLSPTIENIVLNRAGTRVASRWKKTLSGDAFNLRVWDTATGAEIVALAGEGPSLLAISPEGTRLAIPYTVNDLDAKGRKRTGGVKLIDVDNGQELSTLALNPHPDFCFAAFSPNDHWLATASLVIPGDAASEIKGFVQLWDAATGQEVFRLKSETLSIATIMAFSPDGSLFAAGGHSRGADRGPAAIDVWDTATGRQRLTLKGHPGELRGIVFSPDGKRIVSCGLDPAGNDTDIRIWDTASSKELANWSCHGQVGGLAFQPDGSKLIGVRWISPDSESPIQVWDGSPRP